MAKLAQAILAATGASALAAFGPCDPAPGAELPEEGAFDLRLAWSGTIEARIPAGRDGDAFVYQFLGVATNQAGDGFLHNASVRCIGFGRAQGDAEQNQGNCVYVDPDGDRVFADWQDEGTVRQAEGGGDLIGGTDKYEGITGSYTYVRIAVRPAAEGTFQGYTAYAEGSWSLP